MAAMQMEDSPLYNSLCVSGLKKGKRDDPKPKPKPQKPSKKNKKVRKTTKGKKK